MINLEKDSLILLKTILKKYISDYPVWLFGSRATDHCKPHSDIDIAIVSTTPMNSKTLALLEAALAESDLPYKVDVIDFASASKSFQMLIRQHHVRIL
jgi:predicted nucleotidyltransferase